MYSKAKGYLCLPWDIKRQRGIMHCILYPPLSLFEWVSLRLGNWDTWLWYRATLKKSTHLKRKVFIRSNETHIGKAKAKYIALASLLLMIGRTILYRLVGQTWMPENLAPSAFLCFLLLFLAISPLYTHWQKFSRVLSLYLMNEYTHLNIHSVFCFVCQMLQIHFWMKSTVSAVGKYEHLTVPSSGPSHLV